jgi:hypothetical protein
MIRTWSKFTFGFDVESDNKYLDFTEDGFPQTAEIEFGNYTLGEGLSAVQSALNSSGQNTYTVTVNRSTLLVTISADDTFDLNIATGDTAANSIFGLLGFNFASDLTGLSSYTGNAPCGSFYDPQFLLQDYVPPENFKESIDATVNRSASGRVEVVRFGIEQKIEMNIRYITNNVMDNVAIKNNQSGLESALAFMSYISQKKRFEFIPDVANLDSFYKVILESSPGFSKGTGFKLREMLSRDLPDFYETGVLQLRVVS